MTKCKRILATLLAVILLVSASVIGTIAYLTSTDSVTNTFTVGNVKITLDEAKVDEYGVAVESADRVKENTYKLLPGHTYVKDPTVTVANGSEEAHVRMLVTVSDMDALRAAIPQGSISDFYGNFGDVENMFLLQKLVDGWDVANWPCYGYTETTTGEGETAVTSGTYEFRYKDIVDAREAEQKLDALFDTIVVPGNLTNDQIAEMNKTSITVVAQAIQADGFNDADAAWAAFATN